MSRQNAAISRISKLFLDRDKRKPGEIMEDRQRHAITLRCGSDIARSRTLQLSVLTAARIADRCFPGAVRVALEPALAESELLLWPELKQSFGDALISCLGTQQIAAASAETNSPSVIFGDVNTDVSALRATFDGWTAAVGPASKLQRLPEREYCSLAGILAGSLAISELFFAFAEIHLEATRRVVGFSLWRPDLSINHPDALGIQVEFLPAELWTLGLGHLGNAYLWSLGTLPFRPEKRPLVVLNDFDKVEPENVETGLLFTADTEGLRKTRVCSAWLEARGFETVLVERAFDSNFRRRVDEPGLALCGFDTNPARRPLETAGFIRVVESGLGGTPDNFDTISLHVLPNPKSAQELWPDLDAKEHERERRLREEFARANPAYRDLAGDDCGRYDLAGRSIAVPFVGAVAGTLVLAETLRVWHDGPAYDTIKLTLSSPEGRFARTVRNYSVQNTIGLPYFPAT